MKKSYKNNIILLLIFLSSSIIFAEKAVVIVPVADLLGQKTSQETIKKLPLSGGRHNFYDSCPRIHQLLFHEIVDIITKKDDSSEIEISTVYYSLEKENTKRNRYWVLNNNLKNLTSLNADDIEKLPTPISFEKLPTTSFDKTIVTLHSPFYDPMTETTYSAGTRFVQACHKKLGGTIPVFIFNPKISSFIVSTIPDELCIVIKNQTNEEKVALFIKILKSWADTTNGFIPYVFGGNSFTQRFKPEPFIETKTESGSFFSYPQTNTFFPKTGIDCSNLISRAAQIAGIPFFLKNTRTISNNLEKLTDQDILSNGDIIWIPGHVMIVSSVKKNLLIEASSYGHGQGKVHEVPLEKVFNGIKSYKQLIKKDLNKEKVQRVNTLTYAIEPSFIPINLFKIRSVWSKPV